MSENICHFIWYCPIYKELRQSLLAELHKLNLLLQVNSDLLLYGNKDLPLDCNLHIQDLFSHYIIKSRDFLTRENNNLNAFKLT